MTKTTRHKRAEANAETHGAVLLRDWLRRNHEESKASVARSIGVSRGTMSHLVAARQQPTTRTAIDLYYRCGIDVLEWGNAPRKLRR